VLPPIVALMLPPEVSVAEALLVVGTVLAVVPVGSLLLTVVGLVPVASEAEPVVLVPSGLQAASRAAAVRMAGRW